MTTPIRRQKRSKSLENARMARLSGGMLLVIPGEEGRSAAEPIRTERRHQESMRTDTIQAEHTGTPTTTARHTKSSTRAGNSFGGNQGPNAPKPRFPFFPCLATLPICHSFEIRLQRAWQFFRAGVKSAKNRRFAACPGTFPKGLGG